MKLLKLRSPMTRPDHEVPGKPAKRTFSAEYKQRILDEVESCDSGQIGAIIRREGLYASHISNWRRQAKEGQLELNARTKPGRPANDPLRAENERLQRELERMQTKLRKADLVIEMQKMAELLGIDPLSEEEIQRGKKR
jgi:transposase